MVGTQEYSVVQAGFEQSGVVQPPVEVDEELAALVEEALVDVDALDGDVDVLAVEDAVDEEVLDAAVVVLVLDAEVVVVDEPCDVDEAPAPAELAVELPPPPVLCVAWNWSKSCVQPAWAAKEAGRRARRIRERRTRAPRQPSWRSKDGA